MKTTEFRIEGLDVLAACSASKTSHIKDSGSKVGLTAVEEYIGGVIFGRRPSKKTTFAAINRTAEELCRQGQGPAILEILQRSLKEYLVHFFQDCCHPP